MVQSGIITPFNLTSRNISIELIGNLEKNRYVRGPIICGEKGLYLVNCFYQKPYILSFGVSIDIVLDILCFLSGACMNNVTKLEL
jgi:hypothetical protein